MYLNKVLNKVEIKCINLRYRKDRKKRANLQFKRLNIPAKIISVKKHDDPKRGCLESHLQLIKDSVKNSQCKSLMILEDDVLFIKPKILRNFPEPPADWDILYLGGTVHSNMGEHDNNWARVMTWTAHAYIINMTKKELLEKILKAEETKMEIDEYYLKEINPKFKCYMINPMIAIQRDDYSDIEGGKVKYDFMETSLNGFRQPDHEKLPTGEYVLKLDPIPPNMMPNVSIVTPTYHRRKMFPLAIKNFLDFSYPKEKLEWIIIDDSTDPDLSIDDILPRDKRIKHKKIEIKERMSISHKRNVGANEAKYDYIVHMDDDDYYPPESIMARVKVLLKYEKEGIGCVGCSRVGVYDIIHNKSTIATDGIISLSEASMAYKKDFWREQQFNELELTGEYKSFIQNRFNKIVDIPYSFVICAISHKKNYSDRNRKVIENVIRHKDTGEEINFYDGWDEDTQFFMDTLRKTI